MGDFEVVRVNGLLQKNGGNVASYFRTPDGKVIHAVTGPVDAEELLAAAQWAVQMYQQVRNFPIEEQRLQIAAAHQRAKSQNNQAVLIHRLLAENPLPLLSDVYQYVFERILGERVRKSKSGIMLATQGVHYARKQGLPILFIFHKSFNNEPIKRAWFDYIKRNTASRGDPLLLLSESYCIIAAPLRELPALSRELKVPPYSAPNSGTPLFVVTNSKGEQLQALTGWGHDEELVREMIKGLVVESGTSFTAGERRDRILRLTRGRNEGRTRALIEGIVESVQFSEREFVG